MGAGRDIHVFVLTSPSPLKKKKKEKKGETSNILSRFGICKTEAPAQRICPLNIGFLVQICRMFHTQTYTVRTGAWGVW